MSRPRRGVPECTNKTAGGKGDSRSPLGFCFFKNLMEKRGKNSPFGEMAEWTKARDSKSRIPQGVGGSNPSLSVSTFGGIDYRDKNIDYGDGSIVIL